MADPAEPETSAAALDGVLERRRARRRRQRRRVIVIGLAAIIVAGGAGSAWALRGSDGPGYRLASVRSAAVEQTVAADGTLAARKTAAASFAAAGTVTSVGVAVGDKVTAGQSLATLDPTSLDAAVTAAETKVAQAKQQLADDQDAQANGTTSTSQTSTAQTSTSNTTGATFTADVAPRTTPRSTSSDTSLASAQRAVVAAQHTLDVAVTAQDDLVAALVTVCKSGEDTSSVSANPDRDGTITGSAGGSADKVVVTLLAHGGGTAPTTSQNPQTVAAGGTYTFEGLDTGAEYTVQLVHTGVADASTCAARANAVATQQAAVDRSRSALDAALGGLTKAIAAAASSSGGSSATSTPGGSTAGSASTGSGSSGRTGSGATGTGSGNSGNSANSGNSGSSSTSGGATNGSSSTGTTITAQRIAADQKAIDAARADLDVARNGRSQAALTTPIAGTVAAVGIAKGDTVSAGSTSSTITVVGTGALSIDLSIGIADIDLVKAGQSARVTVDGHSGALPATVTYVGQTNSSSSSGSSAAYTVTVQLARTDTSLYDGMGADVSIAVGKVAAAATVPVSAISTSGARHTVQVYSGGKVTTQAVTVGLVGDSLAQVRTGLRAGQRVVLADLGAAIPSSTTFGTRRGGSGLSGLSGGSGAGPGGGRPGTR